MDITTANDGNIRSLLHQCVTKGVGAGAEFVNSMTADPAQKLSEQEIASMRARIAASFMTSITNFFDLSKTTVVSPETRLRDLKVADLLKLLERTDIANSELSYEQQSALSVLRNKGDVACKIEYLDLDGRKIHGAAFWSKTGATAIGEKRDS